MPELKIIQGCVDNNPKCQKELYNKFSPRMYSICLRYCRNPALAADALQIGFMKVFKNIGNYRHNGNLGGWIRSIVVRSAIDQIKKEKRSILQYNLEDINDKMVSYSMDLKFDDFNYQYILSLIDQLPLGYRVVFSMHVLDEMDHGEISKILKISASTSRTQLYRARKHLQLMLESSHINKEYINKNKGL